MIESQFKHFLTHYLSMPSPGGYTEKAILNCKQDFEALGLSTHLTKKGGLIAVLPGKDTSKQVAISAHMDTLGGMVKEILPNGHIRFHKIGGGLYHALEGENCTIITSTGKTVRGSIMPLKSSTHLYGQDGASEPRNEFSVAIRLDEKVSSVSDVHQLGIQVGDFIYMDPRLEITENGFIKSRYIDDKACVAIVLELCTRWVKEGIQPNYTTFFYISNFEEMGHGISNIFNSNSPFSNVHEFVALDIGIVGHTQTSSEYKVSIAAKDARTVYDYALRQKLVNCCEQDKIPYAVDVYNRYSSDASQAMGFGCDFKFACIGPGIDASHHYERTHMESILATSKLIESYLLNNLIEE